MSAAVPADATPPTAHREAPWMAGIHAARANLVPGLIVQAMMLGMLLAYYFYPPTTAWLNQLAEQKARWSYGFTAVSSIVAGALLPELLRVLVFQNGKLLRNNFTNLIFTVPFWCFMGVTVDFFYRCQAGWFGSEVTFAIVLKKVLVDQLLYTPLFATPFTAVLYDWKLRGFGWPKLGTYFSRRFYRDAVIPPLFTAWGLWIPLVSIIYSLPSLLQIPLFSLALSLWVMLYTWMSERQADG
jgi:hypothetical protein